MDEKECSAFYENLLFDPRVTNHFSSERLSDRGGNMALAWGETDGDIFYYAYWPEIADKIGNSSKNADLGRALAVADYLAYVPYGETGYAAFGEIVKELGFSSVADWRYRRFLDLLGDHAGRLPQAAFEETRAFFEEYGITVFHWDNIREITCGICRLRHNAEAYSAMGKEPEDPFCDIVDAFAAREILTSADLFASAPKPYPIGEREIAYLKEVAARGVRK